MTFRAALPPLLMALVGACASTPTAAPWVELFDGRALGAFAPSGFGGDGPVWVQDGCLKLGIGSPLTGVTWRGPVPDGDYELEVTARRDLGTDFFLGLTFPVAGAWLTLVLGGWGGAVCGLSSLDGADAAHNETRTLRHFEQGREYTAHLRVTAARVDVELDGKPFLAADLRGRTLSVRPEVELSRPLGLAAFTCEAAVRSIRWRPLPSP